MGCNTNQVKKMVASFRSPIELEVARDGPAETAHGGLVPLSEVLAAKHILDDLPRTVGGRSQDWGDAQLILVALVLNIAGLDRVSDVDRLEGDAGLCALVIRYVVNRRRRPPLSGSSFRSPWCDPFVVWSRPARGGRTHVGSRPAHAG